MERQLIRRRNRGNGPSGCARPVLCDYFSSLVAAALSAAIAIVLLAACGSSDDGASDSGDRPSLPTAATASGAGATAELDGELYVADRTLPASALSAERLESVGEAESGGERVAMARARVEIVEPWELVSAAPDGWRVWQPAVVLQVLDQAGSGASVAEAETTLWPNACLGVSARDEVCAEVITPGYRVIVEIAGTRAEYRTDLRGNIRLVD
jgi:hypothetical protein